MDADAVQLKCAEVLLDEVAPESVPAWAAEALVGGLDTPALRELAGHPASDSRGARDLIVKVIAEVGLQVPSLPECRVLIVSAFGECDSVQRLGAGDRAKRIWLHWSEARASGEETPPEWLPFVNDASDRDELPDRRDEIAASIRAAAESVVAR